MNARARKYKAGEITAADLASVVMRADSCHYCGIGLEIGMGSFDHGQALDRQGRNSVENIVRSCYSCNRRKFTKTPEEFDGFASVMVKCPIDGTMFKPRYAEWANGRAKYCSRSCAAKSRFHREMTA